ncbi:TPA: hypothetical protein JI393_RS14325 [Acinetobacter baumannii]|nr:hypothetical protein [Acinetobacter baumannii]HBI9064012.1 hypothetical protein [Acinetobacter baumannii]
MNEKTDPLKTLEYQIDQHNLRLMKEAADNLVKLSKICDHMKDLVDLFGEIKITEDQYSRAEASLENVLAIINAWIPEESDKSKKASFELNISLNHTLIRADDSGTIQ